VRTGGKYFTNGEIKSYLVTSKGEILRVNIMTKLFFDQMKTDIQMVGMIREVNSRVENKDYLLIDSKGNIVSASQNFLKETGVSLLHLRNYQFNIGLFSPEIKDDLFEQKKLNEASQKTIQHSSSKPEKTSTNLVSMMMSNMKVNKLKSMSSNNSSEEENEFKNFEGVNFGKIFLPSNLKEVLSRFSATVIAEMSNIKEAEQEEEDKDEKPSEIEPKITKRNFRDIVRSSKKKTISQILKKN
jgi:hypothetical protein